MECFVVLQHFGPFNDQMGTWVGKDEVLPKNVLGRTKSLALYGAIFDILRNAKNEVRKIALNNRGSERISQDIDMSYRVLK